MSSPDRKGHDLAEVCRAMIRSESEQVHRRMTWLATLQGFLFAGVGVAWKVPDSELVVRVLGTLGMTVALLAFLAMFPPIAGIDRVRAFWRANKPDDYDGPDISGYYPYIAPWAVWITV
jgi:hypothetical protein